MEAYCQQFSEVLLSKGLPWTPENTEQPCAGRTRELSETASENDETPGRSPVAAYAASLGPLWKFPDADKKRTSCERQGRASTPGRDATSPATLRGHP